MKRKISNEKIIDLLGTLGRSRKGPDPLFRRQARERLLEKISPPKRPLFLPSINLHPLVWRRLTATTFKYGLSIFLGFVLLGGSTALAAQSSLPTSPLYPIKRATEQILLTVSKVFSQQTQVEQIITNNRLEEARELERLAKEAAKEYKNNVEKLEKADPKLKKEIPRQLIRQEEILEEGILMNESGIKWDNKGRESKVNKNSAKTTGNTATKEEKKQDNPEPQKKLR